MTANNDSSDTKVMNPLLGPSLPSHTSMHCMGSAEPKMKKLRLSGSFLADDGAVAPTQSTKADETKVSPTNNTISTDVVAPAAQPKITPSPVKPAVTSTPLAASATEEKGASAAPNQVATPNPPLSTGTPTNTAAQPLAVPSSTVAPQSNTNTQPNAATAVASKTAVATANADQPLQSNPSSSNGEGQDPAKSIVKVSKYSQLKAKYTEELSYMLREFEKLERQLLGARKTEENTGSRERREKLHSFIIHLQDTITQIDAGVHQEESSNTSGAGADATKIADKVKKLEEHILANLLPVKVRLKKQLAAQQGARHNPVGMPHRGGYQQPKEETKGTFAAAAEKKRQQAQEATLEARPPAKPVEPDQTQYGKPIVDGGSSLTKKLHGPTLGNKKTSEPTLAENKRYYGGMALGSEQIESSVTAASSVHKLMIKDTEKLLRKTPEVRLSVETKVTVPQPSHEIAQPIRQADFPPKETIDSSTIPKADPDDQERRRRRRRRRRKRKLREQEKKSQSLLQDGLAKKSRQAKKVKGPRQVEYMCALCNESYNGTCEFNPWWALTQHECPKCRKTQIPKVDISAPANAIEYHPALLAHADDNSGSTANNNNNNSNPPPVPAPESDPVPAIPTEPLAEVAEDHISLGSDVSSGLGDVSSDGDDSYGLDSDDEDSLPLTAADHAENENFGAQYEGPKLTERDAGRLMLLMSHASTCSGKHLSEKHSDVCRSTQWMMLHVRDCPGTTSTYDICPFPWCRKIKHLLYHLVSCTEPLACRICSHPEANENMLRLAKLNTQRLYFYKKMLLSKKPEERAQASVRQSCKPCIPLKELKDPVHHPGVNLSAHDHPGASITATASNTPPPHPGAAISNTTQSSAKSSARKASKPQAKKATTKTRPTASSTPLPPPSSHEVHVSVSSSTTGSATSTTLGPPTLTTALTVTPNPMAVKTEAIDGSTGTRTADGIALAKTTT